MVGREGGREVEGGGGLVLVVLAMQCFTTASICMYIYFIYVRMYIDTNSQAYP